MKKVMILMTIWMGFCMSLVLSFVGTMMSRHFSVPGWLASFGISFAISLVIGFLIPIKKLGDAACGKCKIPPQSFKGTLVSAAISDLIYTPLITVIMVLVMLSNAAKKAEPGAEIPPVPAVLVPSLIVCLVVGFIVIVIIQPLLIRFLTRNMPRPPHAPKQPEQDP